MIKIFKIISKIIMKILRKILKICKKFKIYIFSPNFIGYQTIMVFFFLDKTN
jgi:hypothetical protein